MTMNGVASDHDGPMLNPPHLGDLIGESMDEPGWSVTETAVRLGCERGTLSSGMAAKCTRDVDFRAWW